jgi:hypothetical protein
MAITSYSTLQDAITTWAMRAGDTDFEAQVPDFITAAEQMFNYGFGDIPALRVSEMETSDTLTPTDGVATLPDDFLELRSVRSNSSPNASMGGLVSPDFGVDEYAYSSASATPNGYVLSGGTIITYPHGTSDIIVSYYAKIPALSDANPTNWLLTKAPMVYLYGALLHAAPYMMDDVRAAALGTMFKGFVDGLVNTDRKARWGNSRVRLRAPTP